MSIRPKHIIQSEKAQSTAEFVLVVPFLLFLFFLMVDFSWLLKNWLVVTNTAREVARCAIVDNCVDSDGNPTSPQLLAEARIDSGITTNLSGTAVQIWYRELAGTSAAGAGDSLIVCIETNNEYISPVLPFLSMISGGGGGGLPDPLPLRAREEMLLERTPTFDVDEGDCEWDE